MKKILTACLSMAMMAFLNAGCDNEDDFSHTPPPGKGCIIANNKTANDMRVYINGSSSNMVSDFDWEAYDLTPGVYRVVLEERHGDRNYRDDIDVIEGRRTVLDVTTALDPDEYDVYLYFD